jgi:hypothetical protein
MHGHVALITAKGLAVPRRTLRMWHVQMDAPHLLIVLSNNQGLLRRLGKLIAVDGWNATRPAKSGFSRWEPFLIGAMAHGLGI